MATSHPDDNPYTIGPAPPQQQAHATFETKPTAQLTDYRADTGGGYERWRSYEYRPHTPGTDKEDVYVPVHRLCAVAWCYPGEWSVADILDDLHGKDVHHESGVEWHNTEGNLTVLDHGRHASVTQSQMRAWAEDAKEQAADPTPDDAEECGRCGADADPLVRSPDWDGLRCLECSQVDGDGSPMEVVG